LDQKRFTEFFLINEERKVIEFLKEKNELLMSKFLKELLPRELEPFCYVKLLDDCGEEINCWYYEEESILLNVSVISGQENFELSIELDIELFMISVYMDDIICMKNVDVELFSNYLINFLSIQAKHLSKLYSSGKKPLN